jgi:hypothetical protein
MTDVVYSWSSATVICLLIFGTAVMALFVVNEWKIAKICLPDEDI